METHQGGQRGLSDLKANHGEYSSICTEATWPKVSDIILKFVALKGQPLNI